VGKVFKTDGGSPDDPQSEKEEKKHQTAGKGEGKFRAEEDKKNVISNKRGR